MTRALAAFAVGAVFGLTLALVGCLEIELSTRFECSPDTYRSGGVTY